MEVLPWLDGFVSVRDFTAFAGELFLLCISVSLSFICPFELMIEVWLHYNVVGTSTKFCSVELLRKLLFR